MHGYKSIGYTTFKAFFATFELSFKIIVCIRCNFGIVPSYYPESNCEDASHASVLYVDLPYDPLVIKICEFILDFLCETGVSATFDTGS